MNACRAPEEEAASQTYRKHLGLLFLDQDSHCSLNKELLNTDYFFPLPLSKFDVGNRAKNKSVMVLAHQEFIGRLRGHVQLSSGFALAMTLGNYITDPSCSLCPLAMPFAL